MLSFRQIIVSAASKWYIRMSLIGTALCWIWMSYFVTWVFRGGTISASEINRLKTLSEVGGAALTDLGPLEWLSQCEEILVLSMVYFCIALFLGYIGFTLDCLIRHFRKKSGRGLHKIWG